MQTRSKKRCKDYEIMIILMKLGVLILLFLMMMMLQGDGNREFLFELVASAIQFRFT